MFMHAHFILQYDFIELYNVIYNVPWNLRSYIAAMQFVLASYT